MTGFEAFHVGFTHVPVNFVNCCLGTKAFGGVSVFLEPESYCFGVLNFMVESFVGGADYLFCAFPNCPTFIEGWCDGGNH